MSNWYYADDKRQSHGPMTQDAVVHAFNNGQIALDTLIWRDGMVQWQPLSDLAGELGLLAQLPESSPPPLPGAIITEPSTHTPATDTPHTDGPENQAQHHADALAAAAYGPDSGHSDLTPSAVQAGEVVYAGFWKRVAAYLIDGLVVSMVSAVAAAVIGGSLGIAFGIRRNITSVDTLVLQGITQVICMFLTASYYGYFHSSFNQATLGKMAVGIKVVDNNGQPISFWRGFGRYFAMFLSGLTLCIGFVMAAFTDRKRALHDMICGTLVVDRWAFTDHPERQRSELGGVTITILVVFGLLLLLAIFAMALALYVTSQIGGG